MTTGPGSQ